MSDLMKRLSAEWALKQLLAFMEDNRELPDDVQLNMARGWAKNLLAYREPKAIRELEEEVA